MLKSVFFASRPTQSKVLEFIVRRTLDGSDVTEQAIGEALFHRFDESKTNVRRAIDLLKKSLVQYYEENTLDTLVIIYLPEQAAGRRIKFQAGEAYKPRFAYNVHHEISKKYLVACRYLQGLHFDQMENALKLFIEVIEHEPFHVGARLYFADALGYVRFFGIKTDAVEGRLEEIAAGFIEIAERLAPEFWHTHASRGFACHLNGDLDGAEAAYERAIKIDAEQTELCGQYVLFLYATGRVSKALNVVSIAAAEYFEDPIVHAMHALNLALHKRFEEANSAIEVSQGLDRNCWATHFVAIRVYLLQGRTNEARAHAARLKQLVESEQYRFLLGIVEGLHNVDLENAA